MKYGDSQVNTNWFFIAKAFYLLHFYFSIKNLSFSILIIPLFHFDPCTHISIDDDQRTRERERRTKETSNQASILHKRVGLSMRLMGVLTLAYVFSVMWVLARARVQSWAKHSIDSKAIIFVVVERGWDELQEVKFLFG